MLILSRKVGEKIHIGDDVAVVVVGIHGKFVKLGIEAPDAVSVDRAEVRRARAAPDVRAMFGTWPGEDDDGFEETIDELRHPGREEKRKKEDKR